MDVHPTKNCMYRYWSIPISWEELPNEMIGIEKTSGTWHGFDLSGTWLCDQKTCRKTRNNTPEMWWNLWMSQVTEPKERGGFLKMRAPQNRWFVMENPYLNGWFRGTTILGNHRFRQYEAKLSKEKLENLSTSHFGVVMAVPFQTSHVKECLLYLNSAAEPCKLPDLVNIQNTMERSTIFNG